MTDDDYLAGGAYVSDLEAPVTTQRLRLDLAYDGAGFHGWAQQPGLRTVEGEVGEALQTIFRIPMKLTVAGRTDAGVHAAAQVASVDVPTAPGLHLRPAALTERLNGLLAASYSRRWRPLAERGLVPSAMADKGISDLVVHQITQVSDDFDARFSALGRKYEYLLVDGPKVRNPITRTDQWWCPYRDLDVFAMQRAADSLTGLHDFLSFCRPREGATTIRELRELEVARDGEMLRIRVVADAFCHSMVRTLVGALVEVGRGRRSLGWAQSLTRSPGREHGVPVAPARGLTLVGVDYPPPDQWAARARAARSTRA